MFGPQNSTALHLARLSETVFRNFGEKKLTGAVFPDVVKAFSIVWVNCLLHKLTAPSFALYIEKTISSSQNSRTFGGSFQTPTSICRWHGSGWNNFPRPFQSVCHGHAFTFQSRLVGCLRWQHGHQRHIRPASVARPLPGDISLRLRAVAERIKISINISNIAAMLFAKVSRRTSIPRKFQIFRKLIYWVDITR